MRFSDKYRASLEAEMTDEMKANYEYLVDYINSLGKNAQIAPKKKGCLSLFHKKKPGKAAVWDHDWDEVRPRSGRTTPIITIAELEEERRKLREEQDKPTPLEIAHKRTEAALKRLEEAAANYLPPVDNNVLKMPFDVIVCINGLYDCRVGAMVSISDVERDLLKKCYQEDREPCTCEGLKDLCMRVKKEAKADLMRIYAKGKDCGIDYNSVTYFFGVPEKLWDTVRMESEDDEDPDRINIFTVKKPRGQPKRQLDEVARAENSKKLFHEWLYDVCEEKDSNKRGMALHFKHFLKDDKRRNGYENTFDWYYDHLIMYDACFEFEDLLKNVAWPEYTGWRYMENTQSPT